MKIIFMGTPEFAVASLAKLVENNCVVVAVITSPDKPSGRGLQVNMSAVKTYALSQNIPVLQPTNLKSPVFLEELVALKADLQIVVAFRMLPEVVWSMPKMGTFNLHGSLLPQYRGAAPINWAIINGEKETGVTTFFLQQEIDTGSIIFQEKETIHENDNVGDLYERLMHKGANLVLKTVKAIEDGEYPAVPQNMSLTLNHAPKIFKETCEIDWNGSTIKIYNFIRGFSPYPAAWTTLQGKNCKIFKAQIVEEDLEQSFIFPENQNFTTDGKKYLIFKTSNGLLSIDELQLEGKKKMGIEEFLRGWRQIE
jgi:methionyl-tRNA formyltransferase